jgi:hypothetical protein
MLLVLSDTIYHSIQFSTCAVYERRGVKNEQPVGTSRRPVKSHGTLAALPINYRSALRSLVPVPHLRTRSSDEHEEAALISFQNFDPALPSNTTT